MQLSAKETKSKFFHLDDSKFPLRAKCPAKEYLLTDWSDVNDMLSNPISGLSLIEHARTISIRSDGKWKHISLESLSFIPEVAMFLVDFSRATAEYIHGYLFPGDLQDQPHIYYGLGQAFDTISSAKSECELDQMRQTRQKANQNGEN